MKIGIDARMYGDSVTGIGNYTKNLIDELLKIDFKNEYTIFLLPQNYDKFQTNSKNVKKVKIDIPWYSWSEQIKLPIALIKEKIDLMHFPHFNVPILYPKKFVVTIHDITPKFFPGHKVKQNPLRRIGYWLVFKLGITRAQKVISVSNHTKQHLIKHFNIKEQKIEVVYQGLNKNLQNQSFYGIIDKLSDKFDIHKPFIFYVGVWREHKNLPNLVKAYKVLLEKFKQDISLVIGGKPDPEYPETLNLIKELNLEQKIFMPGFISEDKLTFFYNQAEVFVLPSFNEGFGLVAIESISLGTPVVASKTTSLPEVLKGGALYFDPHSPQDIAEKINQVLSSKELSKQLVNKAKQVIKKYNWEITAKQTLKIYEEVN
ncbi:glycosyltransferase family 4 protein [Patescibacteria group bacterium]|nr:glycosyltransferase family 4 protein [Patescibacteria group bacterium]